MKMKRNISDQINETEQFSPVLEKMRHGTQGFKVPDGYFDSLSPRIVESIKKQENSSFLKALVPTFGKPVVWAPVMATVIVAVLLIFVVPGKKDSTIPVADEWTELNMAYDESYAEEVLLAESTAIDKELENTVLSDIETISLALNEPTIDEITQYLEEQETDTDILNEY